MRHRLRPAVSRHAPEHIVLRVVEGIANLRRREVLAAIHKALKSALKRTDFRVVHFSLQADHLHLLVEADSKLARARGMQGFEISLTYWINVALGQPGCPRRGKVFLYRYHVTKIDSPLQARRALSYTLNNWRHHDEDEVSQAAHVATLDPFSSAAVFDGWTMGNHDPSTCDDVPPVSAPRSWLLRDGWRKHGPIDPFEVPGRKS